MTKTAKLLECLETGKKISNGEIRNRFGIANPRATVSDLRMMGYPVYLNKGSVDGRGRRLASRYRLGTPSREVVAAGYQALAAAGVVVHR
jgi:hypothetical protein